MADDGDVNIKITADASGVATGLGGVKDQLEGLKGAIDDLRASMSKFASDTAGATSSALDKLKNSASSARGAVANVGGGAAQGLKEVETAASGATHGMSGLVRETLVLFREAGRGDFTRMAGSVTIWTQRLLAAAPEVAGLALGVGALAGAAGFVAYEMHEGAQEQINFANALKLTGDYAASSTGELYKMADAVSAQTGQSAHSLRQIEAALAQTGQVGSASMGQLTEAVSLYAKAAGEKAPEAIKVFLPLFGDTSKAADELNDRMHFLTFSQLEQIRTLQEQGDKAGAVKIVLDAMVPTLQGQAENVGYVEQAWRGWGNAISGVLELLRGWGRSPDIAGGDVGKVDAQVDALTKQKAALEKQLASETSGLGKFGAMGSYGASYDAHIASIRAQLSMATGQLAAYKALQDSISASTTQQAADMKLQGDAADIVNEHQSRVTQLKAQEATLTKAIESGVGNIAEEEKTRANIQRQIKEAENRENGVKKTKPKGMASPLADDQAELAKRLADQKAFGDAALEVERKFWTEKRDAAKSGSTEYAAAVRNLANVTRQQDLLASRLSATKGEDAAQLDTQRIEAQKQAALDGVNAQIDAQKEKISETRSIDDSDLANLRTLYNQRLAIINKAVQDELAATLRGLDAKGAADKLAGDSNAVQRDEDERVRLTAAADAKIEANKTATDREIAKSNSDAIKQQLTDYRNLANRVGDSYRSMIEGLVEHTQTWRQAVIQIERNAFDTFLKLGQSWLVDHAVQKRQEVLAHQAANAAKVASDKTAATTSGQVSFKSALAQIGNDARVAAGGAFKATAGIPIVGPVLAPAAAAAAFAGTLAFEAGVVPFSAAGGMGSVPYDNAPFLLHKNEMVLPAGIANPLRSMLANGGGTAGGSTTNNMGGHTFHIHAAPGMSPNDVADAVVTAINRGHRGLRNKMMGYG